MVFLHGFSVNLASFAKSYPHFLKNHRVIALDYPGYYLSEKKDAPYDIPFMARAVAELLDKLDLKKAVLVGSSMGGAIALEAALLRPERGRRARPGGAGRLFGKKRPAVLDRRSAADAAAEGKGHRDDVRAASRPGGGLFCRREQPRRRQDPRGL